MSLPDFLPTETRPNGCPPGQATMDGKALGARGGRIGNPEHVPSDEIRAYVRNRAKVMEQESIATALGICTRTFRKYYSAEYRDGKRDAIAAVGAKLLSKALAGDNTCMIYYLKTQGREEGWSQRVEVTGKDGAPIEFDLRPHLEGKTEHELLAIEQFLDLLIASGGVQHDRDADGGQEATVDAPAGAGDGEGEA
jgi:hypothetical protein